MEEFLEPLYFLFLPLVDVWFVLAHLLASFLALGAFFGFSFFSVVSFFGFAASSVSSSSPLLFLGLKFRQSSPFSGITFSEPMIRNNNALSITPPTEGKTTWLDDSNLEYTPGKLNYDTNYAISVSKGLISRNGSLFENDATLGFKTIGPVRLLSAISDSNSNNSVAVNNSLRFNFDQELDHTSTESHFSITPQAEGSFSWDSNTLIFMPNSPFQHDT